MKQLPPALEARLGRALLGLPPAVLRVLAGKPIVVDGQTLDTETQFMIRVERLLGGTPPTTIEERRAGLRRNTALVGGHQPIGRVDDLTVPGSDGDLDARLYRPRDLVDSTEPVPLLVYFHGGAMMFGDLETSDPVCRMLAEEAGVLVLSVSYRLAPEHPFPAAVEDAVAAYGWAVAHADELGADPAWIGVGGDSAGASLSAVVALDAAERGIDVALQLLIYPATNLTERPRSYDLFGRDFLLDVETVDLMHTHYARGEVLDPRISPRLHAPVPAGIADAIVAVAGFDVLRDEGLAYAAHLRASGASVDLLFHGGMVHGFANILGIGRSQRRASIDIGRHLKARLTRRATTPATAIDEVTA